MTYPQREVCLFLSEAVCSAVGVSVCFVAVTVIVQFRIFGMLSALIGRDMGIDFPVGFFTVAVAFEISCCERINTTEAEKLEDK